MAIQGKYPDIGFSLEGAKPGFSRLKEFGGLAGSGRKRTRRKPDAMCADKAYFDGGFVVTDGGRRAS